jgi:hypothetical protein
MPSPTNTSLGCNFCSIPGHIERHCRRFKAARAHARAFNTSSIDSQSPKPPSSDHHCSNVALSALLKRANASESPPDLSWIADTGATLHMTPHQQWFTDYKPHRIPICVANNAVVYSEGIGAVVIEPSDQLLLPCKMTDVLYVPDLQNSLLSVLHLVSMHHFRIEIEGTSMSFSQQGSLRFTASIRSNTAYLSVSTPLVAETVLRVHITRTFGGIPTSDLGRSE